MMEMTFKDIDMTVKSVEQEMSFIIIIIMMVH